MAFNFSYGSFTPQSNPYAGSNPYLQQNIDSALGDVTRAYNMTVKPQQAQSAVRSGSFGNSGLAEMQAEQQRQLAQELGRVSSGMRMQDYAQQQQLAESAADRALQAQQASVQANLGYGNLDLTRQQVGQQYDLARQGLDINRGQLDVSRQQTANQYALGQRGLDINQGQLDLGRTQQAQNFALGQRGLDINQGQLDVSRQQANNQYALGLGQLDVSRQQNANQYALGSRGLDLQGQQNANQFALGNRGLDIQNQQANNQYALGSRGLDLQAQNQNNDFYTAQRGQDLSQMQIGANLMNAANAGYLSQGQGLYNLGLTQMQAPWQALQNMNAAVTPYTGFGTTSMSQSGSPLAGALGGAIGAAQLANMFKGSSSGFGGGNLGFGGYTPTTNYSAGANYNLW